MIPLAQSALLWAALLGGAAPSWGSLPPNATASQQPSDASASPDSAQSRDRAQDGEAGVRYLVPEMAGEGFHLEPGKRPYQHRLAFSPALGRLGGESYYAIRLAYNPESWLGYEASIGHNPSESVHALVHTLGVVLRRPLPWRLQPYASLSYGMMLIYPGKVFKADPVTKNVLGAGVGLELFLRDDVAVRGELRRTSVLGGSSRDGQSSTYEYGEFTVGLSFYRKLRP